MSGYTISSFKKLQFFLLFFKGCSSCIFFRNYITPIAGDAK